MDIIEVKDYSFTYEGKVDKKILNQLNFSIKEKTITAIIGLSGCGKTTLCHAICGIIPNYIAGEIQGEIIIKGKNTRQEGLSTLAETIGLVMQNPDEQLVTTTVEDELAFGPENLNLPVDEIVKRVEDILQFLDIEKLSKVNPNKLSGGQKQIVAMGAVLALNPEILVLDEPMSHLDERGRALVAEALVNLKKVGKTIVVVEHDFMTMDFADKWLILSEGKIVGFDSPAKILENKELLVREHLAW